MADRQRPVLQIRRRKLGVLMLDARSAARRTVEECAQSIGATPEQYARFEAGTEAPSLPQLELLAAFLNIPIDHFWGRQALSTGLAPTLEDKSRSLALRARVIGASLRLARANAGLTLEQLAEKSGLSGESINRFEAGEMVPLPELEAIATALDVPVTQFIDQHGPIGRWRAQQALTQQFLELSPDLQEFAARPLNRPYLELALRLSRLDVAKLRSIAESLLEITY